MNTNVETNERKGNTVNDEGRPTNSSLDSHRKHHDVPTTLQKIVVLYGAETEGLKKLKLSQNRLLFLVIQLQKKRNGIFHSVCVERKDV